MAQRTEWTLQVAGMNCMHCARAVDEALREVPGVAESITKHAEGRSVVVAEPTVASAALSNSAWSASWRTRRRLAGAASASTGRCRQNYMPQHNHDFPHPPADPSPQFVPVDAADLDRCLCHEETRIVARDNTVAIDRLHLQIEKQPRRRSCAGLEVTVRRHLDSRYTVSFGQRQLGTYDSRGKPLETMPTGRNSASGCALRSVAAPACPASPRTGQFTCQQQRAGPKFSRRLAPGSSVELAWKMGLDGSRRRRREVRMVQGAMWLRLVVALFVLVPTAGCESTPGVGDADAGDVDTASDTDACDPAHMCYADFPCRDRSFCRNERTVVQCQSVHCSSPRLCNTTCCSGGSCLESLEAPTACPDGTFCFEDPDGNPMGFGSHGRTAECLPDPDADAGADADVDAGGGVPRQSFATRTISGTSGA